jgi:hypothetical protein
LWRACSTREGPWCKEGPRREEGLRWGGGRCEDEPAVRGGAAPQIRARRCGDADPARGGGARMRGGARREETVARREGGARRRPELQNFGSLSILRALLKFC